MPQIHWEYCRLCGEMTQHIRLSNGKYRCIIDHEKTKIALDRIDKGETLKNPKGKK